MAKIDNFYLHYTPSLPIAIVSAVVFTILLCAHSYRLLTTRTWFCVPFVVGALFEVLGYTARAYGNHAPDNLIVYLIQSILIFLAPILFAASIYMFLGRIIRATGLSSFSIIQPTRLTKVFVIGDFLCFNIQGGGAGLLGDPDDKTKMNIAKIIILVGLGLQIMLFGLFMVTAVVWHMRVLRHGKTREAAKQFRWEFHLNMLYFVSIIITIRSVYRVVEYAGGTDSYLMAHEWPTYIFDALLMALVLVICYFCSIQVIPNIR
ncbi:RTA1 like protein [Lophiostoma macrostomum CBS 122681]|uniref:RTA1 like protein n=1 Tax=Lophiostoma macrostomum CBS 122681 TaxID=1314788 RepID=A0A6A6SPN8_9PLEO|nr:RTA1 like protein [Lophiostoma macrostomum CBS 122681]